MEEPDKPYWTNSRVFSAMAAMCILTFAIGGWIGFDSGKKYGMDIAEVWEIRANHWMQRSSQFEQSTINRDATIDKLINELGELPDLVNELRYNCSAASMELEEYRSLYLELQQEHVRLQQGYQALWEIWWDATH